ncbi:8-amino-7-oxononanoate synthase [Sphingomonas paucimobilis]|nr:8-amino-7-oxononanoate synthase [Sphingomonas paucimobilis]
MTEAAAQPHALPADAPDIAPERDLLSKFDGLIAERQKLLDSGVTDPFAIVMEQVKSPTEAVIRGKDTILLGTYNYMGMTFDPDVIAAGKEALEKFGSGTNGSRMLNGTFHDHMEVEQALRDFYGTTGAIVFSTGYMANLASSQRWRARVSMSSSTPTAMRRSMTAASRAMPRSSASATIRSRISTSGWAVCPRNLPSWSCWRASIRCSATSLR